MTQQDMEKVDAWMNNPENLKKLTPLEMAQINLYLQEHKQKVAPIIIGAMSRDNQATFLFKLK